MPGTSALSAAAMLMSHLAAAQLLALLSLGMHGFGGTSGGFGGLQLAAAQGASMTPQQLCAAEALWDDKKYTEALPLFQSGAKGGHPAAQFRVGNMHYYGRGGLQVDMTEAIRWYTLSVNQGYAHGQNSLGYRYLHGQGVAKDEAKALALYHAAAAQGQMHGVNSLGYMHHFGRGGLAVDMVAAVGYYTNAANQGFSVAQYNVPVAVLYYAVEGEVQRVTKKEALYYMQLAADQGHSDAIKNLPTIKARCTGACAQQAAAMVAAFKPQDPCTATGFTRANFCNSRGSPKEEDDCVQKICVCACDEPKEWGGPNCLEALTPAALAQQLCDAKALYDAKKYTEALPLFQSSANGGHPAAQYMLGLMHQYGLGGLQANMAEAVRWYTLSTNQGYAYGQGTMGTIYITGMGVAKDEAKALAMYRAAAAQGEMNGVYNLGNMHFFGQGGLAADMVAALGYFTKAASQGERNAQNGAAVLYYTGQDGVQRDDEQALYYMQLAANQGNSKAIQNLPTIKARCTGACAQDAAAMVAAFQPQNPCTASRFTRANFCNGRGTPKEENDCVQKICVCSCDEPNAWGGATCSIAATTTGVSTSTATARTSTERTLATNASTATPAATLGTQAASATPFASMTATTASAAAAPQPTREGGASSEDPEPAKEANATPPSTPGASHVASANNSTPSATYADGDSKAPAAGKASTAAPGTTEGTNDGGDAGGGAATGVAIGIVIAVAVAAIVCSAGTAWYLRRRSTDMRAHGNGAAAIAAGRPAAHTVRNEAFAIGASLHQLHYEKHEYELPSRRQTAEYDAAKEAARHAKPEYAVPVQGRILSQPAFAGQRPLPSQPDYVDEPGAGRLSTPAPAAGDGPATAPEYADAAATRAQQREATRHTRPAVTSSDYVVEPTRAAVQARGGRGAGSAGNGDGDGDAVRGQRPLPTPTYVAEPGSLAGANSDGGGAEYADAAALLQRHHDINHGTAAEDGSSSGVEGGGSVGSHYETISEDGRHGTASSVSVGTGAAAHPDMQAGGKRQGRPVSFYGGFSSADQEC